METENRLDFIYDSKGRPIGLLIVTRDFNDRKEKEEKLRDEILHTLFDDSPNPIFVTDDSGRHLDINRAGLEFLECRKESLLGKKGISSRMSIVVHIVGGVSLSEKPQVTFSHSSTIGMSSRI